VFIKDREVVIREVEKDFGSLFSYEICEWEDEKVNGEKQARNE